MLLSTLVLFVIGFYILIKGAQILIDGSVSVARLFNVSPWVVGIVIVGIGTSIPEFSINLASIFRETTIGVGTIIGSNVFNTLGIIGIIALITPITMRRSWVLSGFLLNIIAVIVSAGFAIFPILGDPSYEGITRQEGLVILLLFVVWILYTVLSKQDDVGHQKHSHHKTFTLMTSFFMIVAGVVGVFLGGRWVVAGAEAIARILGASESLIGLTIVAVGTSVPELTVSTAAALRRRSDIAVGNIIGSNIFDFLGIFGMTSVFSAISVPKGFQFDFAVIFLSLVVVFATLILGKKYRITRKSGALLLVAYVAYLAALFLMT